MDFSSAHPRSSSSLVFVLNRKKSNDKNAVISQCSLKQLDHENWALGVWCMLCTLERRLLGPGLGLCLLIGLLMGQLLQLLRQSCPWHWGHYYEDKGVVYLPVCLLLQLWQILRINWHFYQNKARVPYLDISTKVTTTAQKKCKLQKGWALDWNPLCPACFANFSLRTW